MRAYTGPRYVFTLAGGTPDPVLLAIEDLVPGAHVHGRVQGRWHDLRKEGITEVAYPLVTAWRVVVPLHGAWLVDGHLREARVAFASASFDVEPWHVGIGSSSPEDRAALTASGRLWIERMVAMGEVTPEQAGTFTPYQVRGVAWSATRRWALKQWATGSGKTCEGVLAGLTRDGGLLILGPAVCRRAWRQDVPRFSTLALHRVLPHSERGVKYEGLSAYLRRMRDEGRRPVVVVGAESLGEHMEELDEYAPTTLILDEIQTFAMPERFEQVILPDGRRRYEARKTENGEIARNVHAMTISRMPSLQQRIGLTALALDDGRPWRYWAILDLLDPDGWGFRRNFEIRYADGHEEAGRWQKTGKSNLGELKARLAFHSHEVTSTEVNAYMPELRVDVIYLEPQDQCAPDAFAKEIKDLEKAAVGQGEDSEAHGNVAEAKLALAASKKRVPTFNLAMECISGGGKCVIFVERKGLVLKWAADLEARIRRLDNAHAAAPVWTATGDTSDAERDRILDAWRGLDGAGLLVATGQSMGMSKDGMQYTDLAIQAQLPRRPGDLVQRRGRFRRLGGRACRYVILVAQYTYDETIVQQLAPKIRNVRELASAEELDGLDKKLLGVDDLERVRRDVLAALGISLPGAKKE